MANEKILVVLKPIEHEKTRNNCEQGIREAITTLGLKIVENSEFQTLLSDEQVRNLYPKQVDQPHFDALREFMTSGKTKLLVVEGDDAIDKVAVIKRL